MFRRLRRGDTLTDQRLSEPVGRADRAAPGTAGVPAAQLPGQLAARRVRARRCRRAGASRSARWANVTRHNNLPVLRRYIRTPPRRLTASATVL
ncbi:MAG: hypothetical protein ACLP50_34285 [Solirubrobacteraceae bacterium]